jgi:S-layer protein
LTVTAALDSSVKTVNASTNTGGVNVTLGAADVAATGGSGADTFAFGATLTTADTVVGGNGVDVISITGADIRVPVANGVLPALNTKVTGVETLAFTGATAALISGQTFTNTEITKLLFNTVDAATDTVDFAGSARTYAFGVDNTGAATLNGTAGVTTVNLALEGTAAAAADVGALTVNFTNNTATQVGTGTINIASTGANGAGGANTTGAIIGQSNGGALTSTNVVVTGSHDLTIGSLGSAGSINASAFTGKLNVVGSSGQDTIIGGSGADTINATVGADTYTGGAGADSFVFTSIAQGSSNALTTISDFVSGTDKLNVNGINGAGTAFTATAINVNAAPDFAGALNLASNAAAAGTTSYFQFGGNTFVVVDNNAALSSFDAATDAVIRLTGVVNLTAADVIVA